MAVSFQINAFDANGFEAEVENDGVLNTTIQFILTSSARIASVGTSLDNVVLFPSSATAGLAVVGIGTGATILFSSSASARTGTAGSLSHSFELTNQLAARAGIKANLTDGYIFFQLVTAAKHFPVLTANFATTLSFTATSSAQLGVAGSLSQQTLSTPLVASAKMALQVTASNTAAFVTSGNVKVGVAANLSQPLPFIFSSHMLVMLDGKLDTTLTFTASTNVRSAAVANSDIVVSFPLTSGGLVFGFIDMSGSVPFSLTSSAKIGLDGAALAQLDKTVDFTLAARGAIAYSLVAPNDGKLNATVAFSLKGKVKTNSTAIEDSQPAPVFPFVPDWTTSPQVTLEHKTDIFKSRSGKEQRRAIRSTARRSVSYSTLVHRTEYVEFAKLIAKKQNKDFVIPDWTRGVETRGIVSGESLLTINGLPPYWLTTNAEVFLIDGSIVTRAMINSAAYGKVYLSTPVTVDLGPATVIRPLLTGQLATVSGKAETSNLMSVNVAYDVTPGSVTNSDDTYASHVVSGKEVFAFAWNWGETVEAEYTWPTEQVDFGRGLTTTHRPIGFGDITQRCTLLREGDEIDYLMRFLERQKGQRGMFWMPSGMSDMEMVSDAAVGATVIEVEGSDVYGLFAVDLVQKGVAIITKDGRRIFRRINSIRLAEGNSLIDISEPLTSDVAADMVAKVSWMRPARFASDDATIEFITGKVAKAQFATVSLPYDADPQDYEPLGGAGLWTMDHLGEVSGDIFKKLDVAVNQMWNS